MNPMMNGLPNVPNVQELWKNEKEKYRIWIIMLAVGLVTILSLLLASFIYNIVNMDSIIDDLTNKYRIADPSKTTDELSKMAHSYFTTNMIVFPSLKILAILAGITLYISSVHKSYVDKNFARLSGLPTFLIGAGALLAFFSILSISWSTGGRITFENPGLIYEFVANIIFILIYLGGGSQVSRIRRYFLLSERIERMKNDPNMMNMQQQFMNMMMQQQSQQGKSTQTPFGTPPKAKPSPTTDQSPKPKAGQAPTPTRGKTVTPSQPQISPAEKRLRKMTLINLRKVAKELSISGSSKMTRDELIEAIMRVTQGN